MRVLHLYSGNMFGGVETILVTLARLRHLSPAMDPHFGVCFPGRLRDDLRATGATVHDLGAVRLSRPWTVLRARRRLAETVRSAGIDVVVGHCCWPVVVFGPTVRRLDRPLVYWAHDAGLTAGRRGWLERLAGRTRPVLTLAISDFTRPFAEALYPGGWCEVLLPPIPPSPVRDWSADRTAVRQELGAADGDVVVVQTSRMVPYKGHRLLLAALGQLLDLPGWACWQVGGPQRPAESDYLSELRAAVRDGGIADRVRFLGDRGDVPRLLTGADIHCQPNTGPELFGITFIEGLAAGLPVVSTAIGAATDILSGGAGVLVPPDDPAALAAALRGLIVDARARDRFKADGPARAAKLCDPVRRMADLTGWLVRASTARGET